MARSSRGGRRRSRGRRASGASWSNIAVLGLAALLVVVVLGAVVVLSVAQRDDADLPEIAWFPETTTSAPGGVPGPVRARIEQITDVPGGGRLTVYPVGEKPGAALTVSLTVLRDGDWDKDRGRRDQAVASRLQMMLGDLDQADVGTEGFSLYGALSQMRDAKDRAGGHLEAWWSTTILTGSIDPLVMTKLRKFRDPVATARSLLTGPVGAVDLHGVELHPVLLPPVGAGQPQLDPESERWRASFLTALAEGLGAVVSQPMHDATTTTPPPVRASRTPLITPIALRTPEPPAEPGRVIIGDVGFIKETAKLIDPAATAEQLGAISAAYLSGDPRQQVVDIVGFCARSGPPDTARDLSVERARTVADLLIALQMIPASAIAEPQGVGFDKLADPTQPPESAAQRAVIVRIHPSDEPALEEGTRGHD